MKAQEHPEFAELLEQARRLTPEQMRELERACDEQRAHYRSWFGPMLRPRVVGALSLGGWLLRGDTERVGRYVLDHPRELLRVIISGSRYADGRRWIHLSVSHRERLPTWEELKAVRARFLGEEATALQVFPPRAQWVNVHPHVLHLWQCVDGDPVPDFRERIGAIEII